MFRCKHVAHNIAPQDAAPRPKLINACRDSLQNITHILSEVAHKIRAAPKTASSAPITVVCTAGEYAIPADAGGAALPAVGDEVPAAEPVAEPCVDSVADPDDPTRDELAEDPDDAELLLAELGVADDKLADDDRVTPGPPVGITLSAELDEGASELEGEGLSTKSTMILISEHWSPIDSSYRLPNAPLMHLHHLVEPPMARELFWQTENPPV
jgi:hypothetical protein